MIFLKARWLPCCIGQEESLERCWSRRGSHDFIGFVSIHCNYFEEDASVSGLECYYFEESDCGKQCAEKILETIADGGNVKTRNVKESDFYVLKRTKTPAVLVELGYLSNTKECRLLSEKEYQETLAEELVKGILASMK